AAIGLDDPELATLAGRLERVDGVEQALATWTSTREAADVARQLQVLGVEAVAVADFGDVYADIQLAFRKHFIDLEHPVMGPGAYEHNGFRLSDAPAGYARSSPVLGQHNDEVLGDILGLSASERDALAADGLLD